MKKFSVLLLSLLMLLSACTRRTETREAREIIGEMIDCYARDPEGSAESLEKLRRELEQSDRDKAEIWGEIMDFWKAWDALPLNENALPEDLPRDSSLCLVALGFELNPDGSMQEELLGRLQVLLRCAEQYPNAYILCTGGGTAYGAPELTEAGQMARWLREQGIAEERLLVEDRSRSTMENALLSYGILSSRAAEVRSLAIITSSYHVVWGAVLFESILLREQAGDDRAIHVLSHAAYPCTNPAYADTRSYLRSQLMSLAE